MQANGAMLESVPSACFAMARVAAFRRNFEMRCDFCRAENGRGRMARVKFGQPKSTRLPDAGV
jgi:hypothetical protein